MLLLQLTNGYKNSIRTHSRTFSIGHYSGFQTELNDTQMIRFYLIVWNCL